jgi:hypothetical protein
MASTRPGGRPGWKSSLPWAVKIDNPPGYPRGTTFQPTFLYECIWDLIVCVAVIAVERRFRIRRGYLIAAYAALYTFGRFFTERMRIDTAHKFLRLRLNDWTSVIVFVVALAVLLLKGRAKPGQECAGDPLPAGAVLGMGPPRAGSDQARTGASGSDTAAGTAHLTGSPQDVEAGSGRPPT